MMTERSEGLWSTTVLIEPSKVSGTCVREGIPSEPRVAASKPRLCMCPLICFHEVFGEGNFCDFCNADASDECECAGEYRGPLNRRCCTGSDDSEPDDAGKRSEVD